MHPLKSLISSKPLTGESECTFARDDLVRVLDSSFDGVMIVEAGSGRVLYINQAMSTWLSSHSASTTDELRLGDILQPDDASGWFDVAGLLVSAQSSQGPYSAKLLPLSQAAIPIEFRIIWLTDAERPMAAVVARQKTLTGAKILESPADRRDPLTGLPDRAFVLTRLSELLRVDRSCAAPCAVMFVDLDNFKNVNDAHGHLMGDRVLEEVAYRLTDCVRDHDHVARFGGDEFVVLAEGVTSAQDVARIIDRIHAKLEDPIHLPIGPISLSVSVGVAVATDAHSTPEDILAEADRAMYASKRTPTMTD